MRSIRVSLLFLILFFLEFELSAQFTASIVATGTTEICVGSSVKAYIYLSKTSGVQEPPYDMVISNSEGEFMILEDIILPHTVYLEAEVSDAFYISSAIDNIGRSGETSDEVVVTVHEATPVSFDLDRTAFLSTEPGYLLKSAPTGATFFGPGVAGSRFYPEISPFEESPYTITCALSNSFGCISTDETDLYVLSGEASLHLVSDEDTIATICDESGSYLLKGNNADGLPGLFELYDVAGLAPLLGFITDADSADNQAIINPIGLIGTFELVYIYGVNELEVRTPISVVINDLGTIGISGIPAKVCDTDEPYPLLPELEINDPTPSYVFSGEGVVGNQEEGFFFDPGSSDAAVGKIRIALDYTSSNGCIASAETELTNQFSPKLSFSLSPVCLPANGGLVSFDNTTSGKYAVESWSWDFGDPDSGDENLSDLESPGHFYSEPGNVLIKLTASTDYGCVAVLAMDTVLADQPEADFTLLNDCFVKGNKTQFLDNSISAFASIDHLTWTFKTKSGGVLGTIESDSSVEIIEFPFTSLDQYQVSLEVTNEVGCSGDVSLPIDLRPVRNLTSSGYYEDFNGKAVGWEALSTDSQSSWLRDEPDFLGFQPEAGDLAWFTNLPVQSEGMVEQSWVQSPCFKLKGLSAPVIQMDLMKSFVPGMDGAVLQYQELSNEGWTTIGSTEEGLNWYKQSDIQNKPGGSSIAWGLETFVPDTGWINAGHSLDMLVDKPFVKFRIALGSGGRQDLGNQGFAFDNIFIGQRNRRSVLEHFTNSASVEAAEADQVVRAFSEEHSAIVYDLHYHMDYPGADQMNFNNPNPPSNRAFGRIPGVPYAILNGGIGDDHRYDFTNSSEEPNAEALIEASLETPFFQVNTTVNYLEDSLKGNVVVTCATDTFTNNLQLYIVVIEREVTAYTGVNGVTSYRNVVLDMLPLPTGKLLGNAWGRGSADTLEFQWEYPAYVEDVEDLSVVAFVQDRDNGHILQADAKPHTPGVGISENHSQENRMALYPNPAREYLYINYGEQIEKKGVLKVLDLSGKLMLRSPVQPGYLIQQLDVSQLPVGMYMIYRMQGNEVKGYSKFIRTR